MSVRLAVVAVLDTLSLAVTPAGAPDTDRTISLLLSPTGSTTAIVLVALGPPASSVTLLSEEERLKLGGGIVTTILVELVTVPEVPVTVTV